MIKNSKNMRSSLCAIALTASVHLSANAQIAIAPAIVSAPAVTAPIPAVAAPGNPDAAPLRRLSLVTEQGSFKNEFKTLSEAFAAAQGNTYNQTLKKGSEIVVMNARSTEGEFADISFSLYAITRTDLEPLFQDYLKFRPTSQIPYEQQQEWAARDRTMIDAILKNLAVSRYPRKAASDPIPVAVSFSSGTMLRLEVDDTQSPMVGPKINDGLLYADVYKALPLAKRDLLEKYGYNNFSTTQDAVDASMSFAGTKVIIFNGTKFSIYRLANDFKFDIHANDEQFDVFKTASIRKGWKIVAIVYGKKFIPIYDPKAK